MSSGEDEEETIVIKRKKEREKEKKEKEIRFYSAKEPYYEFSNFYPEKIYLFDLEFPTSEHAYQCLKFYRFSLEEGGIDFRDVNSKYAELIRKQNTAGKAFYLARQKGATQYPWQKELSQKVKEFREKGVTLREDWDSLRDNVMRRIVWTKFQNEELGDLLLNTGKAMIIEDSPRDSYWGIGKDGNGINKLGTILMEVRALLNPSLSTNPPTDYSNWNIDGCLLSSTSPSLGGKDYIDNFLKADIDTYINLQESNERDYQEYFKEKYISNEKRRVFPSGKMRERIFDYKKYKNILYLHFPIKDRNIVSDDEILNLALYVVSLLGEGRKILVHCRGGKGRTGTLIVVVLSLLYGLTEKKAIEIANSQFDTRVEKGVKALRIPQTKKQVDQVKRLMRREDISFLTFLSPSPSSP